MLRILTGLVLVVIFLFLSAIHFYWGLGGKWGKNASIPTKKNNERIINPGSFACFAVAAGLLAFTFFILINIQLIFFKLPAFISKYGLTIIAGLFIARAIGEFKYVGFFKKNKNTEFGQMDTKYFSPLCLLIGLVGILLELMK